MSQSLPPPPPREPTGPPPPGPAKPPTSERPSWRGWLVLAALLLAFWGWQYFAAADDAHPPVTYTAFYRLADEGKVESVTLRGQHVNGKLKKEESVEGKNVK